VIVVQRLAAGVRRLLAEPATAGLDVDDVETTSRRRALLESKEFLRRLYFEWYRLIIEAAPSSGGALLEIGSGGGFLASAVPGVLTSDVLQLSGVDAVLDATALPFCDGSLRGIVMTNVLHHLPAVRHFFAEAMRSVRPGGALVMVEPWVTPWSRWVYQSLHHEPFDPTAKTWQGTVGKPLSEANGALPWIVFERDRNLFEHDFPLLRVERIQPIMPFLYLLSGGVSLRALAPGWTFPLWRRVDRWVNQMPSPIAMFALIVVRRLDEVVSSRDRAVP
jgi:SAM-dependent methyltransferase